MPWKRLRWLPATALFVLAWIGIEQGGSVMLSLSPSDKSRNWTEHPDGFHIIPYIDHGHTVYVSKIDDEEIRAGEWEFFICFVYIAWFTIKLKAWAD